MHASVLDGVNNRIKVIKRMAYSFRKDEYFFANPGHVSRKYRMNLIFRRTSV